MIHRVQQVLSRLAKARNLDEGEACCAELAKAARENRDEVIQLFYTSSLHTEVLVRCLHGLTDPKVIEVYKQALKHKQWEVRWAAVEGLKYSSDPNLIPTFISSLRDRSELVKLVAVEWLRDHGDRRALAPLERLRTLPSLIKNAPGILVKVSEALDRLRSQSS